jgi:hypothetical protein
MKTYGQLIKARLQQIAGVIATAAKGLIYYNTTNDRPYIDDGTASREIMLRHLLAAGEEISTDEGGTGFTTAEFGAGVNGQVLEKLGAGFVWSNAAGGGSDNFSYYEIAAATLVEIPDNQVMYLHDETIVIDGTLIITGKFVPLTT